MKNKIVWTLRLLAAAILLQTLYFKFSGAPESKFIFGSLGLEPWGRWLAGVSELIASVLLLVPATTILGAAMGIGIMLGAVASHVLILGLVVENDGGLLFTLACTVLSICLLLLFLQRQQLFIWIQRGRSFYDKRK